MDIAEYEKKHIDMLRPYLSECMVLLKKDGNFPIDKPCKVALYGNGARRTVKGGTGSGEVNSRYSVTAEQAFLDAGFEITTTSWLDSYDIVYQKARKKFVKQIRKDAKKHHILAVFEGMGKIQSEVDYEIPMDSEKEKESEICVYVLSRISGEGNDRHYVKGDILLTDTEARDIRKCASSFRKFMLVLNTGGPVDLSPVLDVVQNVLYLSQLGVETGAALVDVILGKSNPSGHLTTSWCFCSEDKMPGSFGDWDDTYYREGIHVGYRLWESLGIRPMFSFGYGLSFTEFNVDLHAASMELDQAQVTVCASVTNTGNFAGKEILQLYVSKPDDRIDQNPNDLVSFAKTGLLAPGQCQKVSLSFDMSQAASYSTETFSWILFAGDYTVSIGTSVETKRPVGIIRVDRDVLVKHVLKYTPSPEMEDWMADKNNYRHIDNASLPVFDLDCGCLRQQLLSSDFSNYTDDPQWKSIALGLSDEDLAKMCVGAYSQEKGIKSIIGNASISVAGAAGETSPVFSKIGAKSLVMADGPAGLRLATEYFSDEKGVHGLGLPFPESVFQLLPKVGQWFVRACMKKPGKKDVVRTQYCTAIPIGTAIAQSWNTDFAKLCGDIVGNEMEIFNVDLWLAPALNIHRDIRCGRNFEYFSEDPLVSGKMASAITLGVQKHKGRGVTIKHFSANNQELNRYGNNSHVSERALREIYLKGFEIAVQESQPASVMTSYNLLNGVHTSQQHELIGDILRNEFGFKGFVMTDWIIGGTDGKGCKYPSPDVAAIVASGGNVIMPGSDGDVNRILEGVKSGKVTRAQLEQNVWEIWKSLADKQK